MEAALEKALANPGLGLLLLDDTNRALAEDAEQLRQEVARAGEGHKQQQETHRRNTDRLADMTHMLDNLQDLVLALRRDIESGTRQERAANSDAEGILRQCKKRHGELAGLQDAAEVLENHIGQYEKELQDLEKNLSGDSGLLEELLDSLADAENDNLLILQYSAEDASKIKELSVGLERASGNVAQMETELASAQGESAAAQAALDQLSNAFLESAGQRDTLLAQWEVTLNHIYQQASQHTTCIEDSLAAQEKTGILQREVEQEEHILAQVEDSVGEVVETARLLEEEASRVGGQLQATTDTHHDIQGQVWGLQNALSKVNKDIEAAEQHIQEYQSLREEKEAFLAGLQVKCGRAEDKINLNTELIMSTEETLHSLQDMIKETESLSRALSKQKERVTEAELHHRQAVARWREEEATVKGEIKALAAHKTRNLQHIKGLDNRAAQVKQLLHTQELDQQELRRRIHSLTHDSNNNAVDTDQQQQLDFLQLRLQEVCTTIRVLTKQLTTLKNTRSAEQANVSQLDKFAEKFESELKSIKMNSSSAERERAHLAASREELRVELSMTQLHLQGRLRLLQGVSVQASTLAAQRGSVEKLVSEQIQEMKARLEGVDGGVRGAEGELHRLSLQLHQASTRVTQLKDKYNKIKCSLDTPEGGEVSTTHVFLKVAEERAGLQEAGDLLDAEVRQAEEEVEALQQMVALLTIEGQQYRSQLHHILHHSEEQKEKVALEERLVKQEEETEVWQTLQVEEEQGLKESHERVRELELQVSAVEELLREKSVHLGAVERETEGLRVKAAHATQAGQTLTWRTRGRPTAQHDVELRLAQERLRTVNTLLGEAVSSHPEAGQALVIYCQQLHIPPPDIRLTKKPSFGSRSSLGSLQSSRSSSRSGMRSVSPGLESWGSPGRHSSRASSVHSQDSGRSGSPHQHHPSASPSPTLPQMPPTRITVISPVFPSREPKRQQYQGKKLTKRPSARP